MANRTQETDDIDPHAVDIAEAPKPAPRKRKKAAAPSWVEPWAEKAEGRMLKRAPSPGVLLEPNASGGHTYASPHDDASAWEMQIHDAFGTRSQSAVRTFLRQLRELCGQGWDDRTDRWKPNETELNAALAFVASVRPRNEMEAALAAQMLAVHFMTMRVSAQALNTGYMDSQTAATAGKLARTFSMQMDTLARIRGRGTSRQQITVRKETHVHHHQHAHIHQGEAGNGTQPHAANAVATPAEVAEERAALPSPDPHGVVVPLAGRQR